MTRCTETTGNHHTNIDLYLQIGCLEDASVQGGNCKKKKNLQKENLNPRHGFLKVQLTVLLLYLYFIIHFYFVLKCIRYSKYDSE